MKKFIYLFIIIFIIVVGGLFILRFVIGGPEDDWICSGGQWVKHGHPAKPMPVGGCGQTTQVNMANPASVNCKNQGGESVIQTAADGSQSGWCKFADGRYCDEWQFFREHNCAGQIISPSPSIEPVIKDKVTCDKHGGKWGKVGTAPVELCNLPLSDGGKVCTDKSDCQGECLASLSQDETDKLRKGESLSNKIGTCTSWELVVGCKAQINKGNVSGLLCVD